MKSVYLKVLNKGNFYALTSPSVFWIEVLKEAEIERDREIERDLLFCRSPVYVQKYVRLQSRSIVGGTSGLSEFGGLIESELSHWVERVSGVLFSLYLVQVLHILVANW